MSFGIALLVLTLSVSTKHVMNTDGDAGQGADAHEGGSVVFVLTGHQFLHDSFRSDASSSANGGEDRKQLVAEQQELIQERHQVDT